MAEGIDLSLCMTTRGKEWLLQRTIVRLGKQLVDPALHWELIVIDDSSDVPIDPFLNPLRAQGVEVKCVRVDHKDGWRGITAGMSLAFELARGDYIAETNSHLLLSDDAVNLLYLCQVDQTVRQAYCHTSLDQEHLLHDNPQSLWVSLRPFNLTTEATIKMDQAQWREDPSLLWELPETNDPWTTLWTPAWDGMQWKGGDNSEQVFGTHLICSIRKDVFTQLNPWATQYKDYGTDDPAYAGARRSAGILDINVREPMEAVAHMAHNNHIEDAMELVPTGLSKNGHTLETAVLWDRGQFDRPTLQEVVDYWESGKRTTDYRIRTAWGYPTPTPSEYIERANAFLKAGKVYLADLL